MAQRTLSLCGDKYIGIESIYTVINGQQVNIPEKLEWLRAKSKNGELFCPCGCGANLILVAGDRNLKEQHFRIKDSEKHIDCKAITEGKYSIDSKIVLKCWLEEKLKASDIESRVQIKDVYDTNRKYEYSFMSKSKNLALSYCHERANLSDEKMDVLESNTQGLNMIYVTDSSNGGTNGQYPEWLMKIQHHQGYVLLLSILESEYSQAKLSVTYYAKDFDGLWQEIIVCEDFLNKYEIDSHGRIIYFAEELSVATGKAKKQFDIEQEAEQARREERRKQAELERKNRIEDQRRQEAERLQFQAQKQAEMEKAKAAAEKEKKQLAEEFFRNIAYNFEQQETQVRDPDGNRWIKCEVCGKIAMTNDFPSYGDPGHINLGTCYECSKKKRMERSEHKESVPVVKYDPTICPECGSKLVEKNGRNGRFIGCTGFPNCRYTRSIR